MKNPTKPPITHEQFQETLEWLNYNGPLSAPDLDTPPSESDKKHQNPESIGS